VVFSSSAGIFGELKTLPIAEDHPQDPDSPYGTSKLAAEKMCLVYNKLCGMHNVCLRYFNVFGPTQDRNSQYSGVVPQFMRLALEGGDPVVFGGGLPQFAPPRLGDVKHSFADITAARRVLGYEPRIDFDTCIALTFRSVADEIGGELV